MDELVERMASDQAFLFNILGKITVHTTELFRDPEVWIRLKEELLPRLREKEEIRIWHPGCSTGQEVYSMLMLLDSMDMLNKSKVYASDIQESVLEEAREGRYRWHFNQHYLENFNKVILGLDEVPRVNSKKPWKRYFHIHESQDHIQMNEAFCGWPEYKRMDLVKDDNIFGGKFDLIICRNVIIYFNALLQERVFRLFAENLVEGGSLLLGVHESILGNSARYFLKKEPFYFKA